jgi:restriction endonuclease S subunit
VLISTAILPEYFYSLQNWDAPKLPNNKLGHFVEFSDETWDQKTIFNKIFPYIEIGEIDISSGEIKNISNIEIQDAPSRAKMIVRGGDILISTTRPNRGAIVKIDEVEHLFIASTGFSIIRKITKNNINNKFLFHILRQSLSLKQMEQRSSGGNYPAITQEELKNILIPNPLLEIQDKIVAKMDDAYAAKKQKELEAQRLLDSIDDYLLGELGIELPEPEENTIKNRIFIRNLSEVSGDRFDPYPYQNKFKYLGNKLKSMPIRVKKLKDIVSFFDYGLMPTQDYAFSDADGLPMIRVINIKKDGYIDMSDIKYIKFDTPRLYQKLVKANDILMVQCGNTTGKCAFVTEEYEGYTFGSFSFVIRGDRNYVDQKYLFNILSSIVVQEQLNKSLTITSVRPNTSKPDVLNFKIPLPPLEKQIEISEHITAIRNQAKQLQQQAKDDLEKAKQEVEAMILGDD